MKNIKNNILYASLLAILFGCSGDDNTGANTRKATDAKATITVGFDENVVYNEGTTAVLNYSIDLDKPQIADIVVKISLVEGTATLDQDFSFDATVTIPANTTQAVGKITLIKDLIFEEIETFTLKIGDENTANVQLEPKNVTVKIGNYQEDDLNIVLNWDGSFEGLDGETDFCDIDLDLELIDSEGDYIYTSYSNCPESITMPATMSDGTYSLVISLWTNNSETAVIDIPAKISLFKIGSQATTEQDISSFFPLATGGLDDGNNDAFIIYTIVKNGTIFTVTNEANAQILQGRKQAILSKILQKLKNKDRR